MKLISSSRILRAIIDGAANDDCPDLLAIAHKDGIPADVLDAVAPARTSRQGVGWLRCDRKLIGHTSIALQCGLRATATPLSG